MIYYRLIGVEGAQTLDLHSGINSLGRNPTNDCVIHEASVSSFHAEIVVAENGVFARDLQSTNGTFLDGQPLAECEVIAGQTLQFGTVAFRLHAEEIRIEVPVLSGPDSAPAPLLEDGSKACVMNPTLPATHQCVKCENSYHMSNLRVLKLSSSKSVLVFCPNCSSKVEVIPGVELGKARKKGLLARISQTLNLGFKRAK